MREVDMSVFVPLGEEGGVSSQNRIKEGKLGAGTGLPRWC